MARSLSSAPRCRVILPQREGGERGAGPGLRRLLGLKHSCCCCWRLRVRRGRRRKPGQVRTGRSVGVQVNSVKGYCVSTYAYICVCFSLCVWALLRLQLCWHLTLYVNLSINYAAFCQDEGETQKNLEREPTNSFHWMQIWHSTLCCLHPSSIPPSFPIQRCECCEPGRQEITSSRDWGDGGSTQR